MINEHDYLARMGNEESVGRLAEFFIDKFTMEDDDEEFIAKYRQLAKHSHRRYLASIFKFAQSEIEKIFLSSMVLGFAGNNPLGVMMCGPKDDAPDFVKFTQDSFKAMRELRAKFDGDPKRVVEYVDWSQTNGDLDEEGAKHWRSLAMVESLLGESFHVIPQATLPEVKVGQRGVRVDMLLFVPMRPEVKIVVECDGYQWHGNKETFTTDRKRDRLLRSKGYDVIRYSGSEIVAQPITCAGEFVIDLLERRDPWLSEVPA